MVAQALRLGLALVVAVSAAAATLEKLALEDMVRKSTEIVRGRVVSSSVIRRGAVIFTVATVSVAERWKGPEARSVTVYVPGGSLDGQRQTFPGAPELVSGSEYVLFLWTGPSRMTQILGFSQGLMDLKTDEQGRLVVAREASEENTLLDAKTRRFTTDSGFSKPLDQLREQVRRLVASE
jgi:hypothetical protein